MSVCMLQYPMDCCICTSLMIICPLGFGWFLSVGRHNSFLHCSFLISCQVIFLRKLCVAFFFFFVCFICIVEVCVYLTEKGCFFAFAQDLFNPLTFYSCMNTCITFCLYIHICVCV